MDWMGDLMSGIANLQVSPGEKTILFAMVSQLGLLWWRLSRLESNVKVHAEAIADLKAGQAREEARTDRLYEAPVKNGATP